MKRRTFLEALFTASVAAPLSTTLNAKTTSAMQTAKLRRMAFATYSLHNFFPVSRTKKAEAPATVMTLPQVFEMVTDRYKIHRFEIHSPHFESTEKAYLDDLKRSLRKYKSTITHVAEVGLNISQKDPVKRAADVEAYKRWVDRAKYLGARTIRINSGKADYEPLDLNITIDSYRQIAAYARSQGLYATIENHWGVSENPDNVIKIVEAVGPSLLTTSPDFGNFTDYLVDYDALARLFKYAKHITSCKIFNIDERGEQSFNGKHPYDFARCMRIMNSSGFRGIVALEYQGEKDPYPMLDKGLALTLQHLEA